MGYDSVLSEVGEFGLYQKLLCATFVFYTTFLCGINYYTQVRSVRIKANDSAKAVLFSFLSKFVHNNHRGEKFRRQFRRHPPIPCSLFGRWIEVWLDVYWSTITGFGGGLFPEVEVWKRGYKKKDDLAETSIIYL